MNEDNNKKNITEGKSFFKKKENLYLLEVFGLAGILLGVANSICASSDSTILYFLSLISSLLIIDGYNQVKKGNK